MTFCARACVQDFELFRHRGDGEAQITSTAERLNGLTRSDKAAAGMRTLAFYSRGIVDEGKLYGRGLHHFGLIML